jgi:hypothetical protein
MRFRRAAMPSASVPETAVGKNRDFVFSKYEIGFARQRGSTAPASDVKLSKNFDKSKLGDFIS